MTRIPWRLNPDFVSWLMGIPVGLTSFALSATALCRWSQRMRSSLYGLVCGNNRKAIESEVA